jgi:hypothetical protein
LYGSFSVLGDADYTEEGPLVLPTFTGIIGHDRTDEAAGSHSVGGCGPWPQSTVGSCVRLPLASWIAATSQQYHRHPWLRIAPSARLGA